MPGRGHSRARSHVGRAGHSHHHPVHTHGGSAHARRAAAQFWLRTLTPQQVLAEEAYERWSKAYALPGRSGCWLTLRNIVNFVMLPLTAALLGAYWQEVEIHGPKSAGVRVTLTEYQECSTFGWDDDAEIMWMSCDLHGKPLASMPSGEGWDGLKSSSKGALAVGILALINAAVSVVRSFPSCNRLKSDVMGRLSVSADDLPSAFLLLWARINVGQAALGAVLYAALLGVWGANMRPGLIEALQPGAGDDVRSGPGVGLAAACLAFSLTCIALMAAYLRVVAPHVAALVIPPEPPAAPLPSPSQISALVAATTLWTMGQLRELPAFATADEASIAATGLTAAGEPSGTLSLRSPGGGAGEVPAGKGDAAADGAVAPAPMPLPPGSERVFIRSADRLLRCVVLPCSVGPAGMSPMAFPQGYPAPGFSGMPPMPGMPFMPGMPDMAPMPYPPPGAPGAYPPFAAPYSAPGLYPAPGPGSGDPVASYAPPQPLHLGPSPSAPPAVDAVPSAGADTPSAAAPVAPSVPGGPPSDEPSSSVV